LSHHKIEKEKERSALVIVTGIVAITKHMLMGNSLSTESYYDVIIVFEIDLYKNHEGLMVANNNKTNKLVTTIHDIIIISIQINLTWPCRKKIFFFRGILTYIRVPGTQSHHSHPMTVLRVSP